MEINSFYLLSYGVMTDFMRLEDNRLVTWWGDQYFPISFHYFNFLKSPHTFYYWHMFAAWGASVTDFVGSRINQH